MATVARRERDRLCDLFLDVGPDAPTLCGEWTTRDLAAHLVMRERRPDGVAGVAIRPLSAYGEKVQRGEAERDYTDLVERLRSGPPVWSPFRVPAVDRMANTIEFFVHHEDVRRGGEDWTVRDVDDELESDLNRVFRKAAKLLGRKAPAGLVLEPEGFPPIVAKQGDPTVTASGRIGELVLFLFGRQPQSDVSLDGPADAVDAIRNASFGF